MTQCFQKTNWYLVLIIDKNKTNNAFVCICGSLEVCNRWQY
jgi:hypothetical protein